MMDILLPTTVRQTARPARKPDAPSLQSHSTASGKSSGATPEDKTTQGP